MKFYIALNHDEIQERIPYALVAETMSGARWGTGKRFCGETGKNTHNGREDRHISAVPTGRGW